MLEALERCYRVLREFYRASGTDLPFDAWLELRALSAPPLSRLGTG